jgi:C4-dicarboxylate transporter DctQ subunit
VAANTNGYFNGGTAVMTGWFSKAEGWLSRINWVMCFGAFFLLTMMMLITVYEVMMRYIFNAPTSWTLEITQYLMLIGLFIAAAYTLEVEGHIKVDFMTERLSPGKQRIVNVMTSVLAIIYFTLLLWESGQLAWLAFKFGQRSMTLLAIPLFPTYVFVPIGSFLMILQGVVQLFRLVANKK